MHATEKSRFARCDLKTPKLRSTTHTLNGAARIALSGWRRIDLRSRVGREQCVAAMRGPGVLEARKQDLRGPAEDVQMRSFVAAGL